MSLECNCLRCGGNDEYSICENALLKARVSVAKNERRLPWMWLSAGCLLALGMALSHPDRPARQDHLKPVTQETQPLH